MRAPPSFEATTRLVARSLGLAPATLAQGLRRAGESDFDAVAAFRARNFDEPIHGDDRAYLGWRYRFGRTDRGLGDLWVLQVDGRLLGVVGTEDLVIHHAGVRYDGFRTMDILVERGKQSGGVGVWLNQALFCEATFVIAVGANEHSIGTVRRLFAPLPDMQAWIFPIDIRWNLRSRWGDGARTTVASAVGNTLLRIRRNLRWRGARGSWSIREIERFDETVDSLFAPDDPACVAIERGSRYLNYRLFDNPRAHYQATGLYRDGALVGYIAWRRVEGASGLSWLYIVDWHVAKSDRVDGAGFLLRHVTTEGERRKCHYVLQARQGLAESGLLRRAGFVGPRKGREVVVGLQAQDPGLMASLLKAEWSLTELDDDMDGT